MLAEHTWKDNLEQIPFKNIETTSALIQSIPHYDAFGQFHGSNTSYNAELMAIYQTLKFLSSKPNMNLKIYSDNQAVVK